MKFSASLLLAPVLLLTTACSSHYTASNHHGHRAHHSSHVSVGVHGGHRGGNVLGALIVGGVIGHLLTEAADNDSDDEYHSDRDHRSKRNQNDELVNGYSSTTITSRSTTNTQLDKNSEQNRYYQTGKDGNCYMMEKKQQSVEIVSMVPAYSCQ